jgi:hypothetical protein
MRTGLRAATNAVRGDEDRRRSLAAGRGAGAGRKKIRGVYLDRGLRRGVFFDRVRVLKPRELDGEALL